MLRQYLRGDSLGRKYKSRYTPLMHWAYVAGAINLPEGSMPCSSSNRVHPSVTYGKGFMGGADLYCCT